MSSFTPPETVKKTHPFIPLLVMVVLVFGFISTFLTGAYVTSLFLKEKGMSAKPPVCPVTSCKPVILPIISDDSSSAEAQLSTKFILGKHFFVDAFMAVTKSTPHKTIVASDTRNEQDSGFLHNTKVSFFNGTSWSRKSDFKTLPDSTIVSNQYIKSWSIATDETRVLKQSVNGEIALDSNKIVFSTGTLQNEIGMRSMPGYTRFMSQGTGRVWINGVEEEAYVLYNRTYSLNSSDIQFYSQPLGLLTDWIAFWDTENNFYHVDVTNVAKPTAIYQTHQIAILDDNNHGVYKTFSVDIKRDTNNLPSHYTVSLNAPINVILDFDRKDYYNRSVNESLPWIMGNIEGSVTGTNGQKIKGIGILEYINN